MLPVLTPALATGFLLLPMLVAGAANADNTIDTEDHNTFKSLSGRRVYKRVCMACHTLNVWGAPKLGDGSAWADRIAKGSEALRLCTSVQFKASVPCPRAACASSVLMMN
ncbi:MAG: hypothetical protein QGG54_15310 [Gammaproteobacteria bacterium]|nr:hypothetical protein [Chromatiales bacterium]MDP6416376.1 hypothetical protein [Gammaproteobacteria bacterium]MDP6675253.1 hypothetical protein [Gammaproteobacteria bacterium]